MRVVKIFNNNVVATITDDNKEAIVTGAGVGFKKKAGDQIDRSKITQTFYIQSNKKQKFYSLLERTPIEYFEISEDILKHAKKMLKKEVSDSALLALTDHISYAIERFKSGMIMPNLILNETQALYKKEYEVGKWALGYIKKRTGVALPEDEAGCITIHIIDATSSKSNSEAVRMIDSVKEIINIIQFTYNIEIKVGTLNYSRLVTHLKFFIRRISQEEQDNQDFVEDMYNILIQKDRKIVECVDKINSFIRSEYQYTPTKSEIVYLMIHILKIIKN